MRRTEHALRQSLDESEAAFQRQYDRAERAEAEVERLRGLLAATERERDLAVERLREENAAMAERIRTFEEGARGANWRTR